MEALFLKILNMSISATFLVVAVLFLRLLFKKRVPKWINVLLWGIVAVRLVVPFSVESRFSLMPKAEFLPVESILETEEATASGDTAENDAAQNDTVQNDFVVKDNVQENPFQNHADGENRNEAFGAWPDISDRLDDMGNAEQNDDAWNDIVWNDITGNTIDNIAKEDTLQNSNLQNNTAQNAAEADTQNWVFMLVTVASYTWLAGMATLLLYTVFSYLRLKKSVATAVPMTENGFTGQGIYQCETVKSPFVLGMLVPKIYLPFAIAEKDITLIVEHEKAHMERRDHWWKPLGFLLLTLHWFNPVLWAAYVLFCRDIELACDEKVVRLLEAEQRAAYSQALLNCNANRRSIAACPLAFGEVGVKERVKRVLNYKKPAFWMIAAAAVVCVVLGICFLTDPVDASETNADLSPTPTAALTETPVPTEEAEVSVTETPALEPTVKPEETTVPSATPQPAETVVKAEPGAYGTLGDIAYYMELSALGKTFEDMDAEASETILTEYGSLLEGYRFVCRQSTDGTRAYILGIYAGEEGADELAGSTIEVTKSELFFTACEGTILILPNEMEGRMNSAVYNYFLESRGREYIADAVSRGVSLDIPEEGPYLTVYLISEEYGELSEMLPVTEEEATLMLAQEREMLQQGYGFAAVLHHEGEDTYFLDSNGVPDKALELAVERCGYRFDSPESITDLIQTATLECDWLANPVCDAGDTIRLTEILKGAEFEGIGKCGYGAKLTLELVNGKVITAYKGTDGCGSIAFGSYGGYSLGAEEDAEFWEIFGLDAENHTPKRAYQLDYEEAPHAMLSAEEWMKNEYLKLPFTWDTKKYAELPMAEKRTMFYIPEEALKAARTADLYNVALEWPFSDYGFNFPSYYLNAITMGFNGMDELFQREDFGATLLWKYKSLNFRPLCTYPDGPMKTDYEIDAWWDENDIVLTEILLATDVVFEQLTDREREMVLEAMEAKMQLRATGKYICDTNVNGFYAYIREYAKKGSKWYAYLMEHHRENETQMKYLYTTGYPTGSVVFPQELPKTENQNSSVNAELREVYLEAVQTLLLEDVFPNGQEADPYIITYTNKKADNYYKIMDIDEDGREELIINYRNADHSAGMVLYIFEYKDGEFHEQLATDCLETFYDNGRIIVEWSHNHGRSSLDDFWPYYVYQYDKETDTYQMEIIVDAWQKSMTVELTYGRFPEETDKDGDGIVYYLMNTENYEPEVIMDRAEYEQWLAELTKGAKEIAMEYETLASTMEHLMPGEDLEMKRKLVSLVGDNEFQDWVVYYEHGSIISGIVAERTMEVLAYNKVRGNGEFYLVIYNKETEETLLLERRVAENGFEVLFLPQQSTTYLPVICQSNYCGAEYYDMSVYRVKNGKVAMGKLPVEEDNMVMWWHNYKPELTTNGTVSLWVRNINPNTGDFTNELLKDMTLYSNSNVKTDSREVYVRKFAYGWKNDSARHIGDLSYVENRSILTASRIYADMVVYCLKPSGCDPGMDDRSRFYGMAVSTMENGYQLVVCKQLGQHSAAGMQNVGVLVYDAQGTLVATDCCIADQASVSCENGEIHVFARYNQQGYVETLVDGVVSFENGKIVYK